jgi:hypothetical protein
MRLMVKTQDPMFQPDPAAKRDLNPGTLYAVSGEGGWIYYGQVSQEKRIGFFRHRDREVGNPEHIIALPVMAKISVHHPSIGNALRGGYWRKLGRFALNPDLLNLTPMAQWPVGTNTVTVWMDGKPAYNTPSHDPAIQDYEIIAAWDAIYHVPERLTADFGSEPAAWHVGGPVWRCRRVKEEMAKRFPDNAAHALPPGYVFTNLS